MASLYCIVLCCTVGFDLRLASVKSRIMECGIYEGRMLRIQFEIQKSLIFSLEFVGIHYIENLNSPGYGKFSFLNLQLLVVSHKDQEKSAGKRLSS